MPGLVKCLLLSLAAGAAAVVATFVALFAAGPTVSAGERAVLGLGVFHALLALLALGGFIWASADVKGALRWLAVIGFELALLVFLAGWFVMTVIMFNR